jgi:predicted Zn finger-like uncharacterized protein
MKCPKCKAKIGIMGQQIILDAGIVTCSRCVICGYLALDPPTGVQVRSKVKRTHRSAAK